MPERHVDVDGRRLEVEEPEAGTSLAAALLAKGVTRFRTSASGEGRGPLCGMGTCFECRVTLDGEAHRRACAEVPPAVSAPDFEPELKTAVAVVGAGPAGIAAACRAAEAGASVVLLDEGFAPGGQIWRHRRTGELPGGARRWLDRLARSGARVLDATAVVDVAPGPVLLAERRGRPLRLTAERLVIATGARELFLPFPGWTLPNVHGVGGIQALLKSGASFRDKRVVLAGSGPLLLPVAALLARNGARLVFVAEQAPASSVLRFATGLWRQPVKLLDAIRYRAGTLGVPYRFGTWVTAASGDGRVQEVTLTDGASTFSMAADHLGCSFGLVPNLELARLLGCVVEEGVVRVSEDQETGVPGVYAGGEATGIGGVERALLEGQIAGLAAAGHAGEAGALRRRRDRARTFTTALASAFRPRAELRALALDKTILCRCEDVTKGSLDPAWGTRAAKLYTRAGMGPCQGRVCGPALEFLYGWQADTVRPPLKPVSVGTLAGRVGDNR